MFKRRLRRCTRRSGPLWLFYGNRKFGFVGSDTNTADIQRKGDTGMNNSVILDERKDFIRFGNGQNGISCDRDSLSGTVQSAGMRVLRRACGFKTRLRMPFISFTGYWLRKLHMGYSGSLTSGSDVYRNSFSTD
jgi:hypothetical protein